MAVIKDIDVQIKIMSASLYERRSFMSKEDFEELIVDYFELGQKSKLKDIPISKIGESRGWNSVFINHVIDLEQQEEYKK